MKAYVARKHTESYEFWRQICIIFHRTYALWTLVLSCIQLWLVHMD